MNGYAIATDSEPLKGLALALLYQCAVNREAADLVIAYLERTGLGQERTVLTFADLLLCVRGAQDP